MTHEKIAAEMLSDYLNGGLRERERVVKECEEQGILAALVTIGLAERPALQTAFVREMRASLDLS